MKSTSLIWSREDAVLELLGENSVWQKGPEFLSCPVENWPMTSASEVGADAREMVSKLQRKAFSGVLTRTQAKKLLNADSPSVLDTRPRQS